jgi:MerR family transcriptional regulator, light-induced transcriptional regulator
MPQPEKHIQGGQGGLHPEQQARLARLIEKEVIPRLLLSLGDLPRGAAPAGGKGSSQHVPFHQVAEFAGVLVHGDRIAAEMYVFGVRRDGLSLGQIYLQVLAPVARHLCELWERGDCSFQEVSGALIRLLAVMRQLRDPATQ